jgi:hypothetical protein
MPQRVFRLFVFGLAVLTPIAAFAQQIDSQASRALSIGVKAAPMFASLDQGQFNWVDRKGAVGGVSFDTFRRGRLSMVTELLYARKGAANLGSSAVLNMLEIPILLKVKVAGSDTKRIAVYGLAGPALDINLRTAQQKLSRINLVDPNFALGAGIDVRWLTIEARENIGLRTLAPNTPDLKARTFSLMVGAKLR